MAGLLTHLSFGFLGFLIIWFVFYKNSRRTKVIYGSLFVLANILPDLVDFGILSIKMGSLSPREIMTHELFHALAVLGHTFLNWVILAVFVLLVVGLLFVLDKISKKVFYGTIVGVILVLIGIAIHLGLDVLIQESSHWI